MTEQSKRINVLNGQKTTRFAQPNPVKGVFGYAFPSALAHLLIA